MKLIKNIFLMSLIGLLTLTMPLGVLASNGDDGEAIDELWGIPTFAYGQSLTPAQKQEVEELLGLRDVQYNEVSVSGVDMVRLLGKGNPNAAMLSSATIEYNQNEEGGIIVEIVTPQNITAVTQNQYTNALITAGAEDVKVKVASPLVVTGHSALTGIYKAYEDAGQELDKDRMQVAQDELRLTTEITSTNKDNDKFNSELLNTTMVDIKKEIGKQVSKGKEVGVEEAKKIVNKELEKNGLDEFITEEHVDKLIDFAVDYASTDAAISAAVLDQLDVLKEDALDKAKEFAESIGESIDTGGFVESVKSFFNNIFSFFADLFSSNDEPEIVEEDLTEVEEIEEPEVINEGEEQVIIDDTGIRTIEPVLDDEPAVHNPDDSVSNENVDPNASVSDIDIVEDIDVHTEDDGVFSHDFEGEGVDSFEGEPSNP